MQPVFTDVMEFEKFGRGKNLRVAKVTIDKLPSLMIPQANAYVVNPMGFNLVLNKEQIEKMQGSVNKTKITAGCQDETVQPFAVVEERLPYGDRNRF